MRTNLKALELIEKGMSSKTVSKLTEAQIDVLHSRLIVEQTTPVPSKPSFKVGNQGGSLPGSPQGYTISKDSAGNTIAQQKESELEEDETDDVTDNDALGKVSLQDYTGQGATHDANDMAPDGMDDDSDDDRKMMGMAESEKSKRKKSSKKFNPWAICTAQLGNEFGTRERHLWNAKEKNKYERCVKDVKKSLKEGKNPVSLFIENKIMQLVETHLPPKISKQDLVKYIFEAEPATAPVKEPKTKPGTKEPPSPVKTPSHPGKNPNPKVNPSPKAINPEEAKEKIIDTIMQILKK